MKELMIMYHPVKKEIRFLAKVKGEFLDIPYDMCPILKPYSPENGEFLLQDHGNQFGSKAAVQVFHFVFPFPEGSSALYPCPQTALMQRGSAGLYSSFSRR